MLRQTQTSPAARLRAQTQRMAVRNGSIYSQALQVLWARLYARNYSQTSRSMKWRKKKGISATASFEECIDAAIEHHLEPAVEV